MKIYSNNSILFIVFLISFLNISCEGDSQDENPLIEFSTDPNQPYPIVTSQVKYSKKNLPVNIQDLIYNNSNTTVKIQNLKDTVVLFVQGGPKHFVDFEDFNQYNSNLTSNNLENRTPVPPGTGFDNHSILGIHQMHELNPSVFGSGTNFTLENAIEVNNQTIDIIEVVINWLKSNNKVIFLFGHANGGQIIQNYMSLGRSNPDFYIISGVRLKTNQDIVNNFPNFIDISYADGTILNTISIAETAKPYFNVYRYLKLDLNKNFLDLLSHNSMLSRTFYSLDFKDTKYGKVSIEEQNFINSNSPHLYYYNGNSNLLNNTLLQGLDYFR